MKTRKLYLICLAGFVVVTLSKQTAAQFTGPYTDSMGGGFNNPISAQMSTMLWNRISYRTTVRTPSRQSRTSAEAASATSETTAPSESTPNGTSDQSALRFRSTGTHLATPKLANQLGNTPAQSEQSLKLMNAVIDGFDQKVKEAGLQNDLAIALSYFLAENIRIYRGLPELSDQQYVNLRNVIAEAFVGSGALNNVTDRQKQEFYEALVTYTGITQFGYEQAKQAGNEQMVKGYQQVAGQSLQTVTKMSPDSMNLSGDGLTASPPQ